MKIPVKSWTEREFFFGMPVWMAPLFVARLRGTPARAAEAVRGVAPDILVDSLDGKWSIQRNLGHLLDLEGLWISRLRQVLDGDEQLRAADMTNRRTEEADHDSAPLGRLLAELADARQGFVNALCRLEEDEWTRSAFHTRLDVPMRILDLAYFVAEHDDHHLARIHEKKLELLSARPGAD
jgi:uncharacterized damage-inducible protein DinB